MAQWLQHCSAKLQLVGSNLTPSCVCGICFSGVSPYGHVPDVMSTKGQNQNQTPCEEITIYTDILSIY